MLRYCSLTSLHTLAALTAILAAVSGVQAQRERRERMDDLLCFTRPDHTRFIIQFTGPADEVIYEFHEYPNNPSVFYVDFYDLRPYFRDQTLPVNNGLLRQVQIRNYPDQNATRVAFVLQDPATFGGQLFEIDGHSLLIDLLRRDARPPEEIVFDSRRLSGQQRVVIIDPGHGGSDAGARSPFRIGGQVIQEKDINLSIAGRVQRLLNETGQFEAHMTRTTDRFMTLEDRVLHAQRLGGEVYVSVHANHAGNPRRYREARGLELYFLSTTGAQRHAGSVLREGGATSQLRDVVLDLANEQIRNSYEMCRAMRWAFLRHAYWRPRSQGGEGHYRGIDRKNFHVLRNFEMPCILIETGFVTNERECRLLVTREFQETVARNIADGLIRHYLIREREGLR